MRRTVVVAILCAAARPAFGQVGYEPRASPFRDLEYRQELSVFGGYFNASGDVAGVAPQSGPAVGVRYELRLGGPAQLMVRALRVASARQLLDPFQAPPARDLGTRSQGLWLADAGISMNLTGQKSYHRLVPVLNGGIGLVTDFKREVDARRDTTASGYRFGTAFALSFGGGVRYTPGGRLQIRADVGDYLYQIKYPTSFYSPGTGVTPVLAADVKQNQWKHNVALTLGASYLFFR